MADPLKTGLSGLLSFQRAIATTSHNIANVNTEGYSRQRVDLTQRPSIEMGFGYVGQGVDVEGIERIQDAYTQSRLEQTTSDAARADIHHELLSRIDNLMAEDRVSLTPVLSDFFNALQDVNSDPASTASRQALLGASNSLAGRFHALQGQFDQLQGEVNDRIMADVADVNTLAARIADLNQQISASASKNVGNPANDLLDQRDRLLNELAEYTRITTNTQEDGAVNVFVGSGLGLVVANQAQSLAVVQDPLEADRQQVSLSTPNGLQYVSGQLTGGKLGGVMDFRRDTLDPMMNQLGRLAVTLADNLNRQHATGLDLDGEKGGDWFTLHEPEVLAVSDNAGNAEVTASFVDTAGITAADYRLDYDGSNYTLRRLDDNQTFTGPMPLTVDGIELDISGTPAAGDSFFIRPTRKAARDFASLITDPNRIALASPMMSVAPASNMGTAEVSSPRILDDAVTGFGKSVDIRFTSESTFDVIDVDTGAPLANGLAYTSGEPIAFNGWEVEIKGDAMAGDVFELRGNAEGIGNNRNGLAIADIQNALVIDGSSSLQQGFTGMVSSIGTETRQAEVNRQALAGLSEGAKQARESISGVNLDEEAINLTRYQQAYQAAAQVIATSEDLFQTLIGAIGR